MKKTILSILVFLFCVLVNAQYQEGVQVEKLLQTDTTVIGQKLAYPKTDNAEFTMAKVIVPVGKQTGWHKHEIPVFAYVLKGTLIVELEDGSKNIYQSNSTISEVFDTHHNGYNAGTEDVELIAIYLGVKGELLSEKK